MTEDLRQQFVAELDGVISKWHQQGIGAAEIYYVLFQRMAYIEVAARHAKNPPKVFGEVFNKAREWFHEMDSGRGDVN